MPFTVETGAGVPGANSYVDLTFADAYFAERSITAWTGANSVKESALIRATDYLELLFAPYFIGIKVDESQALSWPRAETDEYIDVAYATDEIPLTLKRACCEYAVRALTITLLPDPVVDSTGFSVVTTRKIVGPIEKHFTVMGQGGQPRLVRAYPSADAFVTPLLKPSASNRVIR